MKKSLKIAPKPTTFEESSSKKLNSTSMKTRVTIPGSKTDVRRVDLIQYAP